MSSFINRDYLLLTLEHFLTSQQLTFFLHCWKWNNNKMKFRGCELMLFLFIYRRRDRWWRLCSHSAPWLPSALSIGWPRPLSHRGTGRWRDSGHPAGPLTAQEAASGPGLRQTATRQNSVHIRATSGTGKQIPHNSVPVCVRETEPGLIFESDRNPGENLVPKQEDQVEKAKPRGGQFLTARLQLPGQRQPKHGHMCGNRPQLPPNLPQLQLWECDLPHGWCCSTFIHWGAPASLHVQRIRSADLL